MVSLAAKQAHKIRVKVLGLIHNQNRLFVCEGLVSTPNISKDKTSHIVILIQKMFATDGEYETRYIASLQNSFVALFFQIGIRYWIEYLSLSIPIL
jgi:hypothetical protein